MASLKITPFLIFLIFEFVLGTVCFGLYTKYQLRFPLKTVETLPNLAVKIGIGCVAADAFPFLIQIPFLIAYFVHGKAFQHNILNPIVNLIGCIVYLTSGSMGIRHVSLLQEYCSLNDYDYCKQEKAVGSLFVITGIVYFANLIFWIVKLRKAS